jgi:hypothetical protein
MERVSFGRFFSFLVLGVTVLSSAACSLGDLGSYDEPEEACADGSGEDVDPCVTEEEPCAGADAVAGCSEEDEANKGIVVPQSPTVGS